MSEQASTPDEQPRGGHSPGDSGSEETLEAAGQVEQAGGDATPGTETTAEQELPVGAETGDVETVTEEPAPGERNEPV